MPELPQLCLTERERDLGLAMLELVDRENLTRAEVTAAARAAVVDPSEDEIAEALALVLWIFKATRFRVVN